MDMDNLAILVKAILSLKDTTDSKKQIASEIRDLEMKLQSDKNTRVKIIAGLDVAKSKKVIQSQIDSLSSQLNNKTIKVGLEVAKNNGSVQNITNGLKQVQAQAITTGSSFDKLNKQLQTLSFPAVIKTVGKGDNEQSFTDTFKSIEKARAMFKSLGFEKVSFKWVDDGGSTFDRLIAKVTDSKNVIQELKFTLEGDNFKYSGLTGADDGVQKLIESTQKAQDKLKALRTNLASTLKGIGRSYSDPSASKAITDSEHIKSLNAQYVHTLRTIAQLKNADDTTMASMKANANKEIATLKQMVKEFRNAEYAADALRTKDIGTVKNLQTQELDKFINKVNGSKVPLDNMTADVNELRTALANIGDKDSLTRFLNQFDTAKAKFESLKTLYQSIGGYDKQLDNLSKSWEKQGIYAGNLKTTIEGLKSSLANVKTTDGLTSWIGDFNTQIGAISQLPVKIAEYRNQLSSVKTEWDKQHTNVQSIYNAFDKLGSRLGSIKTEAGFDKWVKDFENLVLQSNRLKTNLDSQVATQNKIYEIQSQIVKLNPNKNADEIAHLKSKLQIEEKELANLQFQANVYSKIVSFEEQEKYVTEQTVKARERLETATVKSSDKTTQQRTADMKAYQKQIETAISSLNRLNDSTVFRNNSSNPQVTQTKQELVSLRTEYQQLLTQLQANPTSQGLESLRIKLDELNAKFKTTTATADAFEKQLKSDNSAEQLSRRVQVLKAQIEAYANANKKAQKQFGGQFTDMLSVLNNSPDKLAVDRVAKQFQTVRQEINKAGKAGKTFFQQMGDSIKKFTGWMSMTYAISTFTRYVRSAITELKEIDTILTEISKTSDRTEESLRKLGQTSFATASKYGQKASDYLLGVQEMSRAGFGEKESEQMAELSTLAQSAGNMTAEVANSYLIATNAAYKFGGSAEKLNSVLNSQNYITNRNALNLTELANATRVAGSQANTSSVAIDEMTAAVGTMIATTQEGGETAGRAFKAILMNLQQVSATADDIGDGGEDITTESLTKYEKACASLGVSLKEVKNGVVTLREPMEILEELAVSVSKEAEGSVKVANLINAIGGKHRGNQLVSLLKNWKTYEKMLSEFNSSDAQGSAFEEAMKTAESWQGKLNELSNTWTDFMNGFANSDTAKGVLDFLTALINGADKFRDIVGTIPAILTSIATVGAFKNVGEQLNTPVYAQSHLLCA